MINCDVIARGRAVRIKCRGVVDLVHLLLHVAVGMQHRKYHIALRYNPQSLKYCFLPSEAMTSKSLCASEAVKEHKYRPALLRSFKQFWLALSIWIQWRFFNRHTLHPDSALSTMPSKPIPWLLHPCNS
eukprot:1143545-Pelagomonas_calceolata.AAC.3